MNQTIGALLTFSELVMRGVYPMKHVQPVDKKRINSCSNSHQALSQTAAVGLGSTADDGGRFLEKSWPMFRHNPWQRRYV